MVNYYAIVVTEFRDAASRSNRQHAIELVCVVYTTSVSIVDNRVHILSRSLSAFDAPLSAGHDVHPGSVLRSLRSHCRFGFRSCLGVATVASAPVGGAARVVAALGATWAALELAWLDGQGGGVPVPDNFRSGACPVSEWHALSDRATLSAR